VPGQSYKFTGSVADHGCSAIRTALWLLVALVCAPAAKSQESQAQPAIAVAGTNPQPSAKASARSNEPQTG
jgi:hypothetical protein